MLFTLSIRANNTYAFALRSDVDAIIWLPSTQISPSNEIDINMKHEGTLNAFGYVQASKQQKRFMQCSPDFSYSIICEPQRHIFIYKATHDNATGLKNRNSSVKLSIGQQKLVTLDESNEVFGILCENESTILLTQKHILCLQINT